MWSHNIVLCAFTTPQWHDVVVWLVFFCVLFFFLCVFLRVSERVVMTSEESSAKAAEAATAAAEAIAADAADERGYVARWVGLESNPEVLSEFAHRAGLPREWAFADCYGLDDELLAFVPQPCLAVILIFPWDAATVAARDRAMAARSCAPPPGLYYMEQRVGEACGTIAVIHAVLNNAERVGLAHGPLYDFWQQTRGLDKAARGLALARCTAIEELHAHQAQAGQSAPQERTEYHFICFVCHDGRLYELDGSRPTKLPICHGPSAPDTFLHDAAKVIKDSFIATSNTIAFGVTTLGPAQ